MKKILWSVFIMANAFVSSAQSPRINFKAPFVYPEGVAFDSARDIFYLSSVIDGTIGKLDIKGNYAPFYVDRSLKSSFGMKIDTDRSLLWVCVGDPNYSVFKDSSTFKKMIRVIALDLKTGKKTKDIDLSNLYKGNHFANDLVLDNKGNVYITDSYSPVIYKIDSQDRATIFAQSELFQSIDIGLNGIVWYPEGYLLVINNSNGSLLKVSTINPSDIKKVVIDQFFPGGDGLLTIDNKNLMLVQNKGVNKIFQLSSIDEWNTATITGFTKLEDRFQQPSTCTRMRDKFYVLNSKLNELTDRSVKLSEDFSVQLIRLIPLPQR